MGEVVAVEEYLALRDENDRLQRRIEALRDDHAEGLRVSRAVTRFLRTCSLPTKDGLLAMLRAEGIEHPKDRIEALEAILSDPNKLLIITHSKECQWLEGWDIRTLMYDENLCTCDYAKRYERVATLFKEQKETG